MRPRLVLVGVLVCAAVAAEELLEGEETDEERAEEAALAKEMGGCQAKPHKNCVDPYTGKRLSQDPVCVGNEHSAYRTWPHRCMADVAGYNGRCAKFIHYGVCPHGIEGKRGRWEDLLAESESMYGTWNPAALERGETPKRVVDPKTLSDEELGRLIDGVDLGKAFAKESGKEEL